jgi:hypothetical protein
VSHNLGHVALGTVDEPLTGRSGPPPLEFVKVEIADLVADLGESLVREAAAVSTQRLSFRGGAGQTSLATKVIAPFRYVVMRSRVAAVTFRCGAFLVNVAE